MIVRDYTLFYLTHPVLQAVLEEHRNAHGYDYFLTQRYQKLLNTGNRKRKIMMMQICHDSSGPIMLNTIRQ